MEKPQLVEPGAKYFLQQTLKKCREFKIKYYNVLMNIAGVFAILFVLSLVLYIKYKGKMSPSERARREREKRKYIMKKIESYQEDKLRMQQELITGLPHWKTEYESLS